MKKVVLPIVIIGVAIGAAALLVNTPTQVDVISPDIQPISVRVMRAQLESANLTVNSQGKVQSAQRVNLSSPLAGVVDWVSPALESGGFVSANAVLMRLDSSDYAAAVARSRASVQQAEAEALHSETDHTRMVTLAHQGLASQAQLQDALRSMSVTAARLADANVSLQQAELDLQRTEIRAPLNAVIETRDVEVGQYINRAQTVAILFGADEVEVRVPLAIRQLGYLDVPLGMRGELAPDRAPDVVLTGMYGGREHKWHGKLVRVEASIDASSNSVQSIIRVQQPASSGQDTWSDREETIPLPIGLFVEAEIVGRRVDKLIALPRSVIRNNNQVLVVDAENKMHLRTVEIFRLEDERVLISGGLLAGEVICISPIQAVYDGMLVQPVTEII